MRLDELQSPKLTGTCKPLYVKREIVNSEEIEDWARKQGFRSIMENLHVTICYSDEPVVWDECGKAPEEIILKKGDSRTVEVFDKEAYVLRIENASLERRWEEFQEHGASWKYDGFKPHITICYGGKVDAEKVEPFRGEIILGPEIFKEPSKNKSKTKQKRLRQKVDEGRIEQALGTKVWVSPRRVEILDLLERFDLRGIADDKDIYVWRAHDAQHLDMMSELGLDYRFYDTRFHIFSPEVNDPHTPGDDWRGNAARQLGGFTVAASELGFSKLEKLTSFLKIMKDPSLTESTNHTPKKFWMCFDMPTEAGDRKNDIIKQLSRKTLIGVKGISSSREIMLEYFYSARNAVLVMDGTSIARENDLEQVHYDDPDYLCSRGLGPLYRIWAKDASTTGHRSTLMTNFYRYFLDKLREVNGPVWRLVSTSNLNSEIARSFTDANAVLNSSEELAKHLFDLIMASSGPKSYHGRDIPEVLTLADVHQAVVRALLHIGSLYASESEWIVKSSELKIPDNSSLLICVDNDTMAAYDDWKAGKLTNTMQLSKIGWKLENLDHIKKTIAAYKLDQVYRIRFVDGMTFAVSSGRVKTRKRQRS